MPHSVNFNFDIFAKQPVVIDGTAVHGTVHACAAYADGTPSQYLVRYGDAQGNPCEAWFPEERLNRIAS